jgi:hypothetical protein
MHAYTLDRFGLDLVNRIGQLTTIRVNDGLRNRMARLPNASR